MLLRDQLQKDMIQAMRDKNTLKLSVIRMAKTLMTNTEKKLMTKDLDDTQVTTILQSMIKQRKDSAEQFTKGNRPEQAAQELAEIVIIESYLPKEASEAETQQLINTVISNTQEKNMGNIMKLVRAKATDNSIRLNNALTSSLIKSSLNIGA